MAVTKLNISNNFHTLLFQIWNVYPVGPKIAEETYTIYIQESQQMQVVFIMTLDAQWLIS